MSNRKAFYVDLAERAAWTFVQGFLAVWVVTAEVSMENLQVAAVAGLVSVAKSFLGKGVGDKDSAATLPVPPDRAKGTQ